MTVKLVMLKSGEDIIADVKEIKSNEEVIGYYFNDPLIVKMYEAEQPVTLNEGGSTTKYSSKVGITFFPWIPLAQDTKIPCSADWVITITEPLDNLKKLYQERLDGRGEDDQTSIIING